MGKYSALAMEFINGGSMLELLQEYYSIPARRASCVMLQRVSSALLSALQYLEANGIVHNDVKPENIMVETYHLDHVTMETQVKLIDFGLVQKCRKSSVCCGSPNWISPEKLFHTAPMTNPKNDIFSLGLVLHAMATGLVGIPYQDFQHCSGELTRMKTYMDHWHRLYSVLKTRSRLTYSLYPEYADLICSMIQLEFKDRCSAEEALELPFFSNIAKSA
jgi:serine/threonine protein kinase